MTAQTLATLRPATPADEAFMRTVYASTRADEMALVPWTGEQKAAFLDMQFRAQDRHYREAYAAAEFQVILLDGEPIGRLYVQRGPSELRIMDISLLPEHRGLGIGSQLLRQLLDEAARTGLPVTIHVERFNPALRLYQRLGFRLIEDKGVYYFMQWLPDLSVEANGAARERAE